MPTTQDITLIQLKHVQLIGEFEVMGKKLEQRHFPPFRRLGLTPDVPEGFKKVDEDIDFEVWEGLVDDLKPWAYRIENRFAGRDVLKEGFIKAGVAASSFEFDQRDGGNLRKALILPERNDGLPDVVQIRRELIKKHQSITLQNEASGFATSTSKTVTITITEPSEDNLMISGGTYWFALGSNSLAITTPSSFSVDVDIAVASGASVYGHISSKVAGASEGTTLTQTFTGGNNDRGSVWYGEYSGLVTSNPFDVGAHTGATTSTATSCSTNTTASAAQNDNLVVYVFCLEDNPNTSGTSYTNGTEEALVNGGTRGATAVATEIITGGGTQESTMSWTSGAQKCGGGVAIYKEAAAGGADPEAHLLGGKLLKGGLLLRSSLVR